MNIAVFGAGMMGRAITYDLIQTKTFEKIILVDKNNSMLKDAERFLSAPDLETASADVTKINSAKDIFSQADVVISAIPYTFNYDLTKLAVKTNTHFIDLGGNNEVVEKQRKLDAEAKKQQVTVIPDSGLAPGLVSVVTKDIVESLSTVDSVHLRVGGLPQKPQQPLNYQIVFSINGLINEYLEDALILDHGAIKTKSSMTDVESVQFPDPYGVMEAFLTSGGCSTLPYTYKDTIGYLDYKTLRYPGHCERFKTMLDIGLGDTKPIDVKGQSIAPRDVLIEVLRRTIPSEGEDVVLLKAFGKGKKDDVAKTLEYTLIDVYDTKTQLSAMMRATGFPVSITADLIGNDRITDHGVFCPEEIISPSVFFEELRKRNMHIKKVEREC